MNVCVCVRLCMRARIRVCVGIANKTEHFGFKSRCIVRVAKHLKDGSYCCNSNCLICTTLKGFIANVLKSKTLLKTNLNVYA